MYAAPRQVKCTLHDSVMKELVFDLMRLLCLSALLLPPAANQPMPSSVWRLPCAKQKEGANVMNCELNIVFQLWILEFYNQFVQASFFFF